MIPILEVAVELRELGPDHSGRQFVAAGLAALVGVLLPASAHPVACALAGILALAGAAGVIAMFASRARRPGKVVEDLDDTQKFLRDAASRRAHE